VITLTSSTIATNTARASNGFARGGGLYVSSPATKGTANLHLTNDTIANNTTSGSQGSNGGGIEANGPQGTIDFCTIYGNTSSQGGGLNLEAKAGDGTATSVTSKNTLFANNSASTGPDIAGKVTTEGYNLVQRFDGADFNDPDHRHSTDHAGSLADLKIDAQLRANGGPTSTYALLSDSPAINQVPTSACDVTTDQRGVKRPQQGSCDIGAFEYSNTWLLGD